jgi:DNA-binding transcriptional LysR family regulator
VKLSQLRTFLAVADHRGFARAAERLKLTQPAASRQISALESELGVPLFDRIGRRVQLTSEGEDLLRRTRRLLEDVEAMGERAAALKRGQTGLLRIGATPQVIENLLAGFLARHRRRYPGIEIHLIEDLGARLPGRLERGDAHLCIMPAGFEGFKGRLLYPMHLLAILSQSHRLGTERTLEIARLADEPLLVMTPGSASVMWFEIACQAAHVRPRVLLQSAATHTMVELAKSGFGVAVVPSPVRIPREGVRTVPLVHQSASIGRWAVVAWSPQRFLAPYGERLVDELLLSVRRNYPGREFIRHAPLLPRPREFPA